MEVSRNKEETDDDAGTSAENSEVICDPCKHDGENLPAEGYCVDCDEYLCKDCYKVHCRPSVTRHHVLQEKDNMPRKREAKLETCPIHKGQTMDFYCESHGEVCCDKCRSTSHGKCENVTLIKDILSEIDMTTEFSILQKKIKTFVIDIDSTQHLVQTNLKAIKINHDNARDEMDTLRKAVKEHIDEMENEVDKELKAIRNEDEWKITAYKNTINAMQFDINAMETYIQGKMSGNKKYDLFIAMKNAQSKIKSNHNDLQKIKKENKIRRYTFMPETKLSEPRCYPSNFGTLPIKDHALKSVRFVTNLDVKSYKDSHTCYITGLALMSESLLAIADNKNKTIKLINTETNTINAEISISSPPWDITIIPDNKLVTTIPKEERIQFLSLSMPAGDAVTLERSITTEGKCHGVEFLRQEKQLIVSYCNPGKLEIFNLDGVVNRRIELNFDDAIFLALIPNTKIVCVSSPHVRSYFSSPGRLRYVHFDEQQKRIFETDGISYGGSSDIFTPFGIATDNTRTTYMADDERNKILVFPPVEKTSYRLNVKSEVLIDYRGKKTSPRSIAFCNGSFRLYIGMLGDKVEVYTVA